MRTFEGNFTGEKIKVGIIGGRFNEFITSKLIAGAKDALIRHGVKEENIDLAWVPGAFEIPLVAQKMAKTKKYDAVVEKKTIYYGNTKIKDVSNEVLKLLKK